MRVLIVKTSSLGDIVHTFPAVSDAVRAIKDIRFDWVVEEDFAQMPSWHPAVDRVIPSAIRRWRKSLIKVWFSGEWKNFVTQLTAHEYDAVIDAQGLIKSAWLTGKTRGEKHGLDRQSAREPLAASFYDQQYRIDRQQHAIPRLRQLFSQVLGYSLDGLPLHYGLSIAADESIKKNTILFLHGTTWHSKRWPAAFWAALAQRVMDAGYEILIAAGNPQEQEFAGQIAGESAAIKVITGKSVDEISQVIKAVSGVVAVDTGLAHLATGLGVPTVALHGATHAELTGLLGNGQRSLQASIDCSPCLQRRCPKLSESVLIAPCTETLTADDAWQALQEKL